MRIIAMADTHGFHELLGELPYGDLLVHAGDLCRGGGLDELRSSAQWLNAMPHRHKLVVAGNHDWCFVHETAAAKSILGDHIHYLQDSEVTIEGLRFWGSPWQPEFNDWAFNLPRGAALSEKWALIPKDIDILVTHGPPLSVGDRSGDDARLGCRDLLHTVKRVQPLLHVFGHIHQDGGFWHLNETALANVTTWECERGVTIIDIDRTNRRAIPISIPPARKPFR